MTTQVVAAVERREKRGKKEKKERRKRSNPNYGDYFLLFNPIFACISFQACF